jgi:hypothetical protein
MHGLRGLGEDVLRVHDQSQLAYKHSFWARSNHQELRHKHGAT